MVTTPNYGLRVVDIFIKCQHDHKQTPSVVILDRSGVYPVGAGSHDSYRLQRNILDPKTAKRSKKPDNTAGRSATMTRERYATVLAKGLALLFVLACLFWPDKPAIVSPKQETVQITHYPTIFVTTDEGDSLLGKALQDTIQVVIQKAKGTYDTTSSSILYLVIEKVGVVPFIMMAEERKLSTDQLKGLIMAYIDKILREEK